MKTTRALLLALLIGLPSSMPGIAQQQRQMGVIIGAIYDATSAGEVRGVAIEVEGMPEAKTVTDLNGLYRLDVPPGTYRLKLSAENYVDGAIDGVTVVAGQTIEASSVISNKSSGTTVDVLDTFAAVEATAQALLAERKLAPVVSDSISKEEIRQSVASDAASAVEKVTGVSVVDDGFVYVRGLGERYSATMLNNALLPTTDPEKRVVPLDMFPSSLIDSIKVLKTYTPDLPGEFSGGLVQMQTVEFPARSNFSVSYNNSFNTETTFNPFNTYTGGSRDFWGFDDGTRDIPSLIPPNSRLFPGRYTQDEMQSFGRAFPANWAPNTIASIRPGTGFSVSAGNTFKKLGLVGALTFSNSLSTRSEEQRYLVNIGNNQPGISTEYTDFKTSNEAARLGGVLNAALKLSTNHKLVFRNTWTHDSEKEARQFSGLNGGIDGYIQATRLRFVERGLYAAGLEGEHAVSGLGRSLFHWQFTYSQSKRHEPDLRETIRGLREDGSYSFLSLPQSGLRFFNDLKDHIYEPLGEWSIPFFGASVSGSVKVGFRGTFRGRDFTARRFRFLPVNASALDFAAPTNELLSAENVRPNGFEIRENTRGTDTYTANMDMYGVFGMLDLALGSRLRFVGGVRFEDAGIKVTTEDPLVPGAIPAISALKNRDALPGINVIYSLSSNQNLRFGFGRTLSRPDFRELSPFDFTNVLGGFNTVGNPGLKRATIDNFDWRWEWFPGGDQIIAASYFLKDFTEPIEVTIQPTTDLRQSYVNAAGARNQGVELEFRRNLGFIADQLIPISIYTNFTFVDSSVELNPNDALLLTSKSRPLVGQSRFIYNVAAEWVRPSWRSQARFLVNSVSKRITDVGTFGLPDIYQQGNTTVDLVYQYQILAEGKWNLRFTAENLGNNHFRWTQGEFLQRSYRTGRSFSIGTSFSFF